MRNSILLTGLVGLATVGTLSACDSFVEDVDGPIDRVVSDSLNTQAQVGFLATGVKESFNDAYDATAVVADLLSDAFLFDTSVDGATFPTFGDIDRGEILPDNNSVDGVYNAINEYRFVADDILDRAEIIEFSDDDEGAEARRLALFTGNFHGAIARYFLGTYFGPNGQTGGAPISEDPANPGPVIPTAELYNQAQQRLETALNFLPAGDDGAYTRRVINTMRARIALFSGDRGQAEAFAANGLVQGDAPYQGRYASTSANNWWSQGGAGRTQVAADSRFAAYDEVDNRSLVEETPTVAGVTEIFYRQALYPQNSSPLPFLTWQENALILAEADIFDGDGDDDEARDLINSVRASRGIDDLEDDDDVDQATLLETRDRELFTYGLRLVDQGRFGLPLANNTRYFPLTQSERNANPNV